MTPRARHARPWRPPVETVLIVGAVVAVVALALAAMLTAAATAGGP